MADGYDIALKIGGDIMPLQRSLKQAKGEVKSFGYDVDGLASRIGKMTAAAALAKTAFLAMAVNAADGAREIRNLAQIAGVGTTEFQQMSYAARSVGIEQDKLSDIIKDVNDKIGDFMETGAGPMADFFENIGPKVGVTADNFRDLSGPDALQLYVDSLEQANVSQKEMTFYLEAIASDATALYPLLQDGGAAMGKLAGEAERLNLVLSETDIDRLSGLEQSFDNLSTAATVFIGKLTAEMSPALKAAADEIAEQFGEASGSIEDGASNAADAVINTFATVLEKAASVADFVEQNPQAAQYGLLGYVLFGKKGAALGAVIGSAFEMITEPLKQMGLIGMEAVEPLNQEIEFFESKLKTIQTALNAMDWAGMGAGSPAYDDLIEKATLLQVQISDLKDQIVEGSDAEAEFNRLMQEGSEKGLSLAESMRAVAAAMRDAKQANDEAGEDADSPKDAPVAVAAEESTKIALDAYKQYYAMRVQAARQASGLEKWIQQSTLDASRTILGNLSTLMQTENKKQFEIGKKAAIGAAVIDTIASAQSAFKALSGVPIVGPALGAAAAASALVAGYARVSQISSTSFGSSGGGGAGGAGGGGVDPAVSTAVAGQQGVGAGQNSTLVVEGIDSDTILSGASTKALIEKITQAQKDGYEVKVE